MGTGRPTGEAASFAEGIKLVLLAATEPEARPLLHRLGTLERRTVATKAWYRGHLAGAAAAPRGTAEVLLLVSGYDKANAAHALTCLLEVARPRLVLQFGVAGAFPGQGLGLRDLVLPTSEIYADTGTSSPEGWLPAERLGLALAEVRGREFWNEFPLDAGLVDWAAGLLRRVDWGSDSPAVTTGPCLTLSQVTGRADEAAALQERWGALAESMEGAAAAHVCTLYSVPFLAVRAISNLVGDRQRASWDLRGASERAAHAAAELSVRRQELPAWPAAGAGELGPDAGGGD